MTLAEYLDKHDLTDEAFARQLGDVSPFAVKKWRYRERVPRITTMLRIEQETKGKVAPKDWAETAEAGAA